MKAESELPVQGDERVRLEQGEGHVLGVVRRSPPQLICQVSGATPEHCVTEEPDRHPIDADEAVARDIGRDLAPLNGLMQSR